MKIRRTLKKSHLILTAVSCFLKHSIVDVWQNSEYDSVSEYLRILNMSLVLNIWIYQGYEHVSRFEYARILNILEFWICQGYTGFRICLNNSRIFLNRMLKYAWISWICMNGFCFTFPDFPIYFAIPFLLKHVLTYLNVYVRLEVTVWRNMKLFLCMCVFCLFVFSF